MLKFYATTYKQGSKSFSFSIYACSLAEARSLARLRNIGEEVIGVLDIKPGHSPQPLPSVQYKQRLLVQCLHTISFYSWIASRAGHFLVDELLSDLGVIHEILHEFAHPDEFSFREEIMSQIEELEIRVPGLKRSNGAPTIYHNLFTPEFTKQAS